MTPTIDHDGRIWSVGSGRLLRLLRGHFFPVRTGSYSPDGRWIVTASQFTAGLWNAGTGQLVFLLGRDTKPLTGASFNQANLTGATLESATLTNANFNQANLTNSEFGGATLSGANLTGAEVRGANFTRETSQGTGAGALDKLGLLDQEYHRGHS